MWIYKQSTGELFRKRSVAVAPTLVAQGFAGVGAGRNNPDLQCQEDVGPIPRGKYKISGIKSQPTEMSLVLIPDPATDMCSPARSGFLIHGDRAPGVALNPNVASSGCIILAKDIRTSINESGDTDLEVIR